LSTDTQFSSANERLCSCELGVPGLIVSSGLFGLSVGMMGEPARQGAYKNEEKEKRQSGFMN